MSTKDIALILTFDDKGTPRVRKIVGDVKKELTKLEKGAKGMSAGFDHMAKRVEQSTSGMNKFKKMLKSTAVQMAAGMGVMLGVQGGIRAIRTAVTDFIKTGREFEKTWANVTTMLTISEKETLKLKDQLIGLSPTLGGTTELAKAMYQVLSASIDPAKAVMFLGEAAKSAVAGVTDAFVAVDALTTVINAYGMSAEAVTKVSDIMFQTVKRGKLTYEGMAGALGTVVPIASQVGVRFEELGAAMATLTRQGIDVNTTTVSLRQIMVSVLKPTTDAEAAAKRLGIQFDAAAIKSMGFQKWLQHVIDALDGDVESMTALFGNIRALTGVMGLAGKSAADFAYDLSLMEQAAGSTEEAFRKQMKSLDFWIRTTVSTLEKMKVAFYEGLVSPIRDAITEMDKLEDVTAASVASSKQFGESLGTIGRYVLPLVVDQVNQMAEGMKGFDKIVALGTELISRGLVPSYGKMIAKKREAVWLMILEQREQKKLGEHIGGAWGMIAEGAVWWKRQVNYYMDSGMAAEEYLKELNKLRKGQQGYQKQIMAAESIELLRLKTKSQLRNELTILTSNIEAAASSDLVFTRSLKEHITTAMRLAEVTGETLSPTIIRLAKELDIYKDKALVVLSAIKGVIVGTEWWNKETISFRTIMQNVRSGLISYAWAWGQVNLKLRESSEFMKKYAIKMPEPDTDPWMSALDRMKAGIDKLSMHVSMVTSGWDAVFNQLYQNQITRIDNEYREKKEAIDKSMKSDQEKYFAIEKLDREMDKKRLAAKKKQAMAAKATSLMEAIVYTASAVVEALPNIPLSIVVGGLGAAQVALIATQPLPSYAEGGIALAPQIATVAERGPELIAPLGDLVDMIREVVRSELGIGAPGGRPQVLRLHQDVYIAGDRVEEKVTEMVMKKAEVGDLTFPAKVIR